LRHSGTCNQPPGARDEFPAKEIVDAGFLELVRYGVRGADDSIIKDSLRVVDAVLKVQTPHGLPGVGITTMDMASAKTVRRTAVGQGRPWPLLTGERAITKLQLDAPLALFEALENFSQGIGLMPDRSGMVQTYLHIFASVNHRCSDALLWHIRNTSSCIALLPTIESSIWSSSIRALRYRNRPTQDH